MFRAIWIINSDSFSEQHLPFGLVIQTLFYNEIDFNTPCSWISGYSGLNYINPTLALRHVFGLSQWSMTPKFVICQVIQHSKLQLLILYQQLKTYTNPKITPLSAETSLWLLVCGRTRFDPWQTFLYAPSVQTWPWTHPASWGSTFRTQNGCSLQFIINLL